MKDMELKLSDEVISQVAKLLQVALLTGTDVIDNLRQLRICEKDNCLFLTDNYKTHFETNLQKMLEEIPELSQDE